MLLLNLTYKQYEAQTKRILKHPIKKQTPCQKNTIMFKKMVLLEIRKSHLFFPQFICYLFVVLNLPVSVSKYGAVTNY